MALYLHIPNNLPYEEVSYYLNPFQAKAYQSLVFKQEKNIIYQGPALPLKVCIPKGPKMKILENNL